MTNFDKCYKTVDIFYISQDDTRHTQTSEQSIQASSQQHKSVPSLQARFLGIYNYTSNKD